MENTNIQLEKSVIQVNLHFQTAETHMYAIGDVIGGVQLAHAAAYEGIQAVDHIAKQDKLNYAMHNIPRCVYSRPEIASIGYTEHQAKDRGFAITVSKIPFRGIGKAWVHGDTDGFVKVIADAQSNDILGVHMIGSHVTELISEVSVAQLLNGTPWEIAQSIHPHPTLSEIVQEAMQAIGK